MALLARGFRYQYRCSQVRPIATRFFFSTNHSPLYQARLNMATNPRKLAEILKSTRDTREYRGLELGNKMKVLLISDPKTDISAAGLSVAAGSMHDPKELPGLAHFLEHMLFLGTEMFPVENEYSQYLAEHSGFSNAYTAQDHTCYYFDVAPDALHGALLRFAQFFIKPLFTPSMTEREVNAVNSEHEKNIPNDVWRIHQLEVSLSNPNHPYHSFATGNRDTLWNNPQEKSMDVRGALLRYYESSYSANLMNLIIYGKESLDELQEYAENFFSTVVNTDILMPKWTENPYGPDQVQYRVNSVPIKDIRHLKLSFPVPDTSDDYKCVSDGYLSHLIGHEGPGSLLSLLKKKSLVNNLAAGCSVLSRGNAVFRIDLELTPEGLEGVDEIITIVFQYFEMLRSQEPKEWIWKEIVNLAKIMFEYQDKIRPQVYVAGLSSGLHNFEMSDILSHGIQSAEFKPELINSILAKMVPENCLVLVTAKECKAEADTVEPFYGIEYSKKKIDPRLIKKWKDCGLNEELKLPEPNCFIPEALELKARDENKSTIPRLLKDDPLTRVWYLQDNEFQLPKGFVRSEIYSPCAYVDALHVNLNSMFVSALKDLLTEEVYDASLADLRFVVMNTSYGMDLIFKGYDDKISTLLETVLKKLTNFCLTQKRFDVLKDYMVRGLKNWGDDQPYHHAMFYVDYLLHDKKISYDERLANLDQVTLENLKAYVDKFLAKVKLEILVCGNFTAEDSLSLANTFEKYFEDKGAKPVPASEIRRRREVNLPKENNLVLKSGHRSSVSSCAAVYFQAGQTSTHDNAIVELIESIANEPCYNQLRTEEQLGYVVLTQVRRSNGTQGINVIVQSNFHPFHVDMRIHDFLEKFKVTLREMPEEQFQQHKSSLIVKKCEKPKKISERALRIWSEIGSQQYQFDRQVVECAELKNISKAEIVEYYEAHIASGGSDRKRIGVHIVSDSVNAEPPTLEKSDHIGTANVIETADVDKWKKTMELYPAVVPSLPKAKL